MSIDHILASIPSMPGAQEPHCHSPMTAGEVVLQLLAYHPMAQRASMEDVEVLVEDMADVAHPSHRPYQIGGEPAGNIGGPGTWISTGKKSIMLGLSATMPLVYPQGDVPRDTTLLARLTDDLRRRVAAMGFDPDIVSLLAHGKSVFGDGDTVTFASPATASGEDVFHGHFSHNAAPWTPTGDGNLQAAAETIVAHHVHADEIMRRTHDMRNLVVKRFAPLGSRISDTVLISVTTDKGDLKEVRTTTAVTILGHTYDHVDVMVNMVDPHQVPKGEFDGLRDHSRTMRRRLKTLAGRQPIDAFTICPVTARFYGSLPPDEARGRADAVRRAMKRQSTHDARSGNGAEFADGTLFDTVRLADKVTFRGRSLMAQNLTPPQTVLTALPGRPMTDVVPNPLLEGLTVSAARLDKKGRLIVTANPTTPIPLRALLERMEDAT